MEEVRALYGLDHWWGWLFRLATVLLLALAVRWLAKRLVGRFFRYALRNDRLVVSERRARTLEGLLSSLVTFVVIGVAGVGALLWLGASAALLFPVIGLFSAGLGLGARPLVSDYLAGITLLFEYSYAFGEKVEILDVIGTVEFVGLRTTRIRADSGELFVVPNGDVRVVRNFSRGAFSPASILVRVPAAALPDAVAALQQVADEARSRYDDEIIERPEVISELGELGGSTQLTLVVKARFGHGAHLRRLLLADVQAALAARGIEPTG